MLDTLDAPPGAEVAPGVSLHADATPGSVAVVEAMARGVAEALELGLEPTANLVTVAIEGSRNVVAHAYPAGAPGPLWVRIQPPIPDGPREITVAIRDDGRGCRFWPTADEPPGVGISLTCELAHALAIRSGEGQGTTLEVAVATGADADAAQPRPPAPLGLSELQFGDPSLLGQVLPRALVALAGGPDAPLEEMVDVALVGETLGACLADHGSTTPLIRIANREIPDEPLRLVVEPVSVDAARRVVETLRAAWDGPPEAIHLAAREAGDRSRATIEVGVARSHENA